MGHSACFHIFDELLPGRAFKIAAAPAVVRIVDDVRVAMLFRVGLEVVFLVSVLSRINLSFLTLSDRQ
jgi:hypothetical protein